MQTRNQKHPVKEYFYAALCFIFMAYIFSSKLVFIYSLMIEAIGLSAFGIFLFSWHTDRKLFTFSKIIKSIITNIDDVIYTISLTTIIIMTCSVFVSIIISIIDVSKFNH